MPKPFWLGGYSYYRSFDLEIRHKKVTKNVVADHLSRLPVEPQDDVLMSESFPDEQLLTSARLSSFADIVNYLLMGEMPEHWSKHDRFKFLSQVKYFFWDDPYMFK